MLMITSTYDAAARDSAAQVLELSLPIYVAVSLEDKLVFHLNHMLASDRAHCSKHEMRR